MKSEEIKVVTKGTCSTAKQEDFVAVKNYLIVEEDGKRYLIVKLVNGRNEKVTGVTLCVEQYDERGEKISVDRTELEVLGYPEKTFAAESRIPLADYCADCSVYVEAADFDGYSYTAADTETPVYKPKRAAEKRGDMPKPPKNGVAVTRHSLNMRVLITVIAIIVLAAAFIAIMLYVEIFKATEKEFMRGSVTYEFADGDRSDGSALYVTGVKGKVTAVDIPASISGHPVVRINAGAFSENNDIRTLRIAGSTEICDNAFYGCVNLSTVAIEKVESIGKNAFGLCFNLSAVKLDGIESVGESAFYSCKNLGELVISESAEPVLVGKNAFSGCVGLKTVDIGRTVEFSGDKVYPVFAGSINADSFRLAEYSYDAAGGGISALFEKSNNAAFDIKRLQIDDLDRIGDSFLSDIRVAEFSVGTLGSDEVGKNAFSGCTALSSVKLPLRITKLGDSAFCNTVITEFDASKLEVLGESAFSGCSRLERVSFEDNSSLEKIPRGAFAFCSALKSVTLPQSVESVGESAFSGCSELVSVVFESGSAMREISGSTFSDCVKLAFIKIPPSTRTIGEKAFQGCTSLGEIELPNGLLRIGKRAFFGCGLTAVTVPDSVESVGTGALGECSRLQTLTVPFIGNTVGRRGVIGNIFSDSTYSGVNAFNANMALPDTLISINVTSASELGEGAFRGCAYLQRVKFTIAPSTVGAMAFTDCAALSEIELGDGEINSVGESAFSGCAALKSIVLPDTVTELGEGAFRGCVSLESAELPFIGGYAGSGDSVEYLFGDRENARALKRLKLTAETFIGDSAFENCTGLREIKLDCDITSIGSRAFYGCRKLNSFTLPSTLTYIGEGAFYRCFMLYEVYNNSELDVVARSETNGYVAYYALEVFDKNSADEKLDKVASDGFEFVESDGKWYLVDYTPAESVILPDAFTAANGQAVTSYSIYSCLFCDDAFLKRVVIPSAVTEIGSLAFYGCRNLSVVDMYSGVKAVGESAFGDCVSLTYIELPTAMTVVPNGLFAGCSALTSVEMPPNYTEIGASAFERCAALRVIEFSDRLTRIGENAFYGCASLKRAVIGRNITSVGFNAFYDCVRLVEVVNISSHAIEYYADSGITQYSPTVFTDPYGALPSVVMNDCHYYQIDGKWTLVDYYGNAEQGATVTVGPLNYAGRLEDIAVRHHAFIDAAFGKLTANGVIAIEEYAFYNCAIGEIEISSRSLEIEGYAFYRAYPGEAAAACKKITLDVSGRAIIRERAFFNSSAEPELSVRAGSVLLDAYALSGSDLKKLTVTATDDVTVEMYALSECPALEELTLRTQGDVTICSDAVQGSYYSALPMAVVIDGGRVNLNPFAFRSCRMSSVNISGSGESVLLDNAAFSYCSIENADIVGSAVELGGNVFAGSAPQRLFVYGTRSVTLNGGALDGMSAYDIALDAAELTLPERAFASSQVTLRKLTLRFNSCNALYRGMLENYYNLTEVTLDGATSIPARMFANCGALTSVTLSPSVTKIGEEAFSYCSSLSSITIPSAVTELGSAAFAGCGALTSVALPYGVTEISDRLLSDCTSLASVSIPTTVRRIGDLAFSSCYALRTVVLPQGLTEIGEHAFAWCNSLIGVAIPQRVTAIGQFAFYGCYNLVSVTLPTGITTIAGYTFAECSSLKDIAIPEGVVTVGERAFFDCYQLGKVVLPSTLVGIGNRAFGNCNTLTELVMPDSVTAIGDWAFSYCSSLNSVKLSASLTTISTSAFYGCGSLTSVDIPGGVTTIAQQAFAYCSTLRYVKLPTTLRTVSPGAFLGASRLFEVSNRSSLDIKAGSSDHGGVAFNAVTVNKADTEQLKYTEADSRKYVVSGSEWYLYECAPPYIDGYRTLVLPESDITPLGRVPQYSILKNTVYGNFDCNIVLPSTVKSIAEGNCPYGISTIYYKGDESEWNAVKDSILPSYRNVMFYAECLHENGKWSFDANGNVTLTLQPLGDWAVVKQSTCTEHGERRRTCPKCGYYESEQMEMTEHDYDADGRCKTCGAKKQTPATNGKPRFLPVVRSYTRKEKFYA